MTKRNPLGTLSLVLCVLYLLSCKASQYDESVSEILPISLRGEQNQRRLKRPDHPCVLVKVEVEHGESEEANETSFAGSVDFGQKENKKRDEVRCELMDDDVEKADGNYFVPIVGITSESLKGIESGVSTLLIEGSVLFDGALQIPQDASIEFGSIYDYTDENDESGNMRWRRLQSQHRNRRLGSFGTKKVVVVRADAYDQKTSANMAELSDSIFGSSGDNHNLKSQYNKCSHGQLKMEPYNGSGVIEVKVDAYVTGVSKFEVERSMTAAATELLGNLNQFDHVMLCLPKGTSHEEWVAYAYVNSWLSVFNDDWCQKLSTQVHEIGHNLGLAHSGIGGDDYGDKSGMMGYSYSEDDTPLQCFNPAKSYELGWYKDSVVEWDPIDQGTWFGNIVGVTDYDSTQTVIVKIPRAKNGKHLYIGYNRKKGFNRSVKDHGDRLVIIEEADGYEVSNFIEGLHPTSSESRSKRTFYNFEGTGKNLVVEFKDYGDTDSINKAFVAIYFDYCVYPKCCRGNMCNGDDKSMTPSPTKRPTRSPTKSPTTTSLPEIDPTPLLFEILPNPTRALGQYIEIYNPHSTKINLEGYRICRKNGRRGRQSCNNLIDFTLDPGEYFMLCRNKLYVPNSRTCHQNENFRILKVKKQIISLVRGGVSVDKVAFSAIKEHPGETYLRKSSRLLHLCGAVCWGWASP